MKAMIMAAGVGSRLMPLTTDIPKPMVPIVNTPVMEYCVRLLKNHGVKEIIANTHYLPETITGYFSDGKDFGVNLRYSYEEELLGTAGGVKNNRWFLDEPFFIVSGDALTNINLTDMYKFHKEKGALATLALKPVKDVTQFGVVVTDRDYKITAFQEKPKKSEALTNLVNTGIYIFEPEIFEYIPEGFYDFGRELFPKLVELKERIYGYPTQDYWRDVGSLNVYKQANWDVLNGNYILEGIEVTSIKSEGLVKSKLSSEKVVIGKNCIIGKNSKLKNCIIWDNCIIEDNVVVEDAIIGANCIIGEGTVIKPGVVIGGGSIIGKNVVLSEGVRIEAKSRIQEEQLITSANL
ncbi:MAG: NDP-sugar synthase [Clostridia bacterium]|nr:NDP-sugar synthase [Clostridia bacterium]